MTSYDGKNYQYVPGRDPPNKEPPVSKYVVESLYRVHRERLAKTSHLVDSHVHIPEFMKNRQWRKILIEANDKKLAEKNEIIFSRLQKYENGESGIMKEIKEHRKKSDRIKSISIRLKEQDRMRRTLKIQKDNEHLLSRIERARPALTCKEMKDWYDHHIFFKEGRYVSISSSLVGIFADAFFFLFQAYRTNRWAYYAKQQRPVPGSTSSSIARQQKYFILGIDDKRPEHDWNISRKFFCVLSRRVFPFLGESDTEENVIQKFPHFLSAFIIIHWPLGTNHGCAQFPFKQR